MMEEDLQWNLVLENTGIVSQAVRENKEFYKEINKTKAELSLPLYKDSFDWHEFLLKCPYVGVFNNSGIIAPCAIISSIDLDKKIEVQQGKADISRTYRIFYYTLLENPSDIIINKYLIATGRLLGEKTEGVCINKEVKGKVEINKQISESPKAKKKKNKKTGIVEETIEIGGE